MIDTVNQYGAGLLGNTLWLVVWSLIKIIAVVLPLMICVAYLTLWERKGIALTQIRRDLTALARWGCCSPSPMR